MDPVTHSLFGAALSRAGLRRTTPLATATLVLAANAPDIDVLTLAGGAYTGLAFRRGVTHGPLALLVLPFVVMAVMLAYDRARRWRGAAVPAARAGPLLALALLGVATHAPLDWLNTYGIRLLAPFRSDWFYGDALFIIDPWVWLMLAAAVVAHTRSRRGWIGWFSLAVIATGMMFVTPEVPVPARIVWAAGIAAIALHAIFVQRTGRLPGEPWARTALIVVAVYIAGMIVSDLTARRVTLHAAREHGLDAQDMMVAPVPANPFAAGVVVRSPGSYTLGTFDWLSTPRVRWLRTIPEGPRNATVLETLRLEAVRDFLRWSRFPFVQVTDDAQGTVVRWKDARYPGPMRGGLGGVTIRVDVTPPAPAPER